MTSNRPPDRGKSRHLPDGLDSGEFTPPHAGSSLAMRPTPPDTPPTDRPARADRGSTETWSVKGAGRRPQPWFASAFASWAVTVTETVCAPLVRGGGRPADLVSAPCRSSFPGRRRRTPAPRQAGGGGTGDGPVAAGGRRRLEPRDGAVTVEALGRDEGAGGVPATGPDPLPTAAGRPGAWRHTASSAFGTFFAFLSTCRPRSRWRPWSRRPRPGTGPRPRPPAPSSPGMRRGSDPTSAFCGRSQAPWSSLAETRPRKAVGSSARRPSASRFGAFRASVAARGGGAAVGPVGAGRGGMIHRVRYLDCGP